MNGPFYTRTRIHQTRNRHEIGLLAQEIREQLHFAKLTERTNSISSAVDLFHDLAWMLDELACLVAKEAGEDPRPLEGLEPFYCAAEKFSEWAAERRQEQRIAEDSDERTDRGCHEYHQGRGA